MSDFSQSEKLARAVADDLNAAASEFAIGFIAKYEAMPEYTLSDLKTVKLAVSDTGERSIGRGTRGGTDYEYDIRLIAHLKIDDAKSVLLSRLKLLGERACDYFMFRRPTGCEETIERVEVGVLGQTEDMERLGIGRFVTTLVFTGSRSKPQ